MSVDEERLLASTSSAELLPPRRRHEAERMQLPLRLVASAPLGPDCHYLLVEDERGVDYGVPAVPGTAGWRRAVAGDGAAEAAVAALMGGGPTSGPLEVTVFHAEPAVGERIIDVDQTNELIAVGDAAVVKWMLHPVAGPQPGPRRLAALAAAGFDGTPRTWGLLHLGAGAERVLIATVSDYLPDAEDGWDWAVREVRLLAQGEDDETDGLDWVREVARLVGRLHVALATEGIDHAGAAEAADWLARAEADLAAADLEPALAARAASRIRILGRSAGTPIMDVHGDLHIGQVLATGDPRSFYVIDFDGNPMQESAERLSRQPAARDVAGMLASLDHVGRVVLHRTEGLQDDAAGRVHRWIDLAQQAFLAEYRETLADAGRASLLDVSLLDAMQVQQECREYAYAARYLPHWRYVPDAALPALLARTPVETESP